MDFIVFVFVAMLAVAAVLGVSGLLLMRLSRGEENEFLRVLGAAILFVSVLGAVGLVEFRVQMFNHLRQQFGTATPGKH